MEDTGTTGAEGSVIAGGSDVSSVLVTGPEVKVGVLRLESEVTSKMTTEVGGGMIVDGGNVRLVVVDAVRTLAVVETTTAEEIVVSSVLKTVYVDLATSETVSWIF